jgi:hypothetical protein
MRSSNAAIAWAVYQIAAQGKLEATRAVCDQREWEAIERSNPGQYTLIRGNITNEGEAERLARGTSGDTKPRVKPAKSLSPTR